MIISCPVFRISINVKRSMQIFNLWSVVVILLSFVPQILTDLCFSCVQELEVWV